MDKILKLLKSEPVAFLGVVTAIIGALIAFNVLTAVQGGGLVGVVTALGSFVVRKAVTPTAPFDTPVPPVPDSTPPAA